MKNITDELSMVNLEHVCQLAFKFIDVAQKDNPPAVQVAALAVMFKIICSRFKVKETKMLELADRIIKHDDKVYWRVELAALRDYMREEL
mgnify:CR=1 FL=1|tara:strand:+ start:265 stop:534 length:270 start_codon:yes stop_codon:yes gene_type:complete